MKVETKTLRRDDERLCLRIGHSSDRPRQKQTKKNTTQLKERKKEKIPAKAIMFLKKKKKSVRLLVFACFIRCRRDNPQQVISPLNRRVCTDSTLIGSVGYFFSNPALPVFFLRSNNSAYLKKERTAWKATRRLRTSFSFCDLIFLLNEHFILIFFCS